MAIYRSEQQLYDVLREVFDRIKQSPEIETFTRSNLVIRLQFSDPQAEVLLDGRQPPMEVFFGERPGRADLELAMPADELHAIWLGKRKLKDSFFSGQIQTKGNVFRAMKLADLFREAERTYPHVLAEKGLL